MRQPQPHHPRSGRPALAALAAALVAVAAVPASADAGLTLPHAADPTPTVPRAAGSGAPAPAPSPQRSPSPAPSSEPGETSGGASGSDGADPLDRPSDYGIPGFSFPRPEKPPSGSPGCGPGCEEQWTNYLMAAAQAADSWSDEAADPAEAQAAADLADSLWSQAASADERLNGPFAEAESASASPEVSAPAAGGQVGQQGEQEAPADAVPLGWLVPGESDLSGSLIEGAMRLLEYLPTALGSEGTTTCAKEETIDGKVPLCPN